MKTPQAKLTLFGFEPFGPYKTNPAAELAGKLDGSVLTTLDGTRLNVVGVQLPIDFGAFKSIIEETVRREKPDMAFGLGMGFEDGGPALELRARQYPNYGTDIPDKNGVFGPSDAHDGIEGDLFVPYVHRASDIVKSSGSNIRLSTNAGQHMCEATLRTLLRLGRELNFVSGFLHLPHTPEQLEDSKKLTPHEFSMPLDKQERMVRGFFSNANVF